MAREYGNFRKEAPPTWIDLGDDNFQCVFKDFYRIFSQAIIKYS